MTRRLQVVYQTIFYWLEQMIGACDTNKNNTSNVIPLHIIENTNASMSDRIQRVPSLFRIPSWCWTRK